MVSICDRLKQRYGNSQQNWQSLLQDKLHQNNIRDVEFIQYIVNFIIEQAKHNIVISELPDVIRTLHTQAEAIIRKNKTITLDEAIVQVQIAGAKKYPYLKKVKPIGEEDFIKEVIRTVFDRLGTVITLDMVENICQFTSCSAKQLLHTMPNIDVDEAATLISEDISRNQRDIHKKQHMKNTITDKMASASSLSITKPRNRQGHRMPEDTPSSINKERMKFEHESYSNQSKNTNKNSKTQLSLIPKYYSSSIRKSIKENMTNSSNQKMKLFKTKSNTQTYSIHSDESIRSSLTSKFYVNSNVVISKNKLTEETKFNSIHPYNKYRYQNASITNNDEQIIETDTETCPLEDIITHRFTVQI